MNITSQIFFESFNYGTTEEIQMINCCIQGKNEYEKLQKKETYFPDILV